MRLQGHTDIPVRARASRFPAFAHSTERLCIRSDLNTNSLAGYIPDSLGSLTALQYLCVHVPAQWGAAPEQDGGCDPALIPPASCAQRPRHQPVDREHPVKPGRHDRAANTVRACPAQPRRGPSWADSSLLRVSSRPDGLLAVNSTATSSAAAFRIAWAASPRCNNCACIRRAASPWPPLTRPIAHATGVYAQVLVQQPAQR